MTSPGWWSEFFATIQARGQNPRASLASVQHQEAHLSVALDHVIASLLGREHPKGTFEAELLEAVAHLGGSHIQRGSFQAQLQEPLASLMGVHFQLGNIAATGQHATAMLTALQYQRGNIAVTLRKPAASMSGYLLPQGPLAVAFKKPVSIFMGSHIQRGSFAAPMIKPLSVLIGKHTQRGSIAVALQKAQATLIGKQTQQGSIAVPGKKPVASMNGTFTGVTPVVFDVVGTPGTEATSGSAITCTINPASGADVLCFATSGGRQMYGATYGSGGPKMRVMGRARYGGGQLVVFLAKGVSSGSATITIDSEDSLSGWAQCCAISYTGAVDWKIGRAVVGSGTTVSQTASPGSNGLAIQSFANGDDAKPFSSLSGGTGRLNETAGFNCFTIRENNISGTFSASQTSSPWGGVVVEATPSAITGPKINYVGGRANQGNGGSGTFDIQASTNDYIVVDIMQDRAGDPSSVTCAGTAMTLMDTQTFTTSGGTGFLKRYRSGQLGSGGAKTISITSTGSGWWVAGGCSVSGVTSFGTATKSNGTSSSPSQATTCSAGQLILQSFATNNVAATDMSGANLFDSPGASQAFLYVNAADQSTTFSISNSMNWAAMATVIS